MWSIPGVSFLFPDLSRQDPRSKLISTLRHSLPHATLTVQFVEYEVSRVVSRDIIKVVSQIF